mmetsp:Transcript_7913/g.11955  ORF Transcript_7913/g.11955 Transcript_7913/m.11955 type:complete len:148 (-) Transcript_7913:112-555(-)
MSEKADTGNVQEKWWYDVPIYGHFQRIKDIASKYDYIKKSYEQEVFYFRGSSVHPKLSEFPQCKDVIRDYYKCKDLPVVLQMMSVCEPLKEQLSSCINLQFVKRRNKDRKNLVPNRQKSLEKREAARQRDNELKLQHVDNLNSRFTD